MRSNSERMNPIGVRASAGDVVRSPRSPLWASRRRAVATSRTSMKSRSCPAPDIEHRAPDLAGEAELGGEPSTDMTLRLPRPDHVEDARRDRGNPQRAALTRVMCSQPIWSAVHVYGLQGCRFRNREGSSVRSRRCRWTEDDQALAAAHRPPRSQGGRPSKFVRTGRVRMPCSAGCEVETQWGWNFESSLSACRSRAGRDVDSDIGRRGRGGKLRRYGSAPLPPAIEIAWVNSPSILLERPDPQYLRALSSSRIRAVR